MFAIICNAFGKYCLNCLGAATRVLERFSATRVLKRFSATRVLKRFCNVGCRTAWYVYSN